MKWFYSISILFISIFSTPTLAGLPETIKSIKPSIVGVGTYNKLSTPRAQLRGTGFVVGNNLIATNDHVVDSKHLKGTESFVVFIGVGNQPEVRTAKVISRDRKHDLALLSVSGPSLPAVKLSSQSVQEGELYSFTGFPIGAILGLYPATHRGIISSITPIAIPANTAKQLSAKQLKQLKKPYYVYQFDATAYPGNSGSPVYHPESGEVIAVINKVLVKSTRESAISSPSAITYAIPIKHLKNLIANL
ncbi:serine protease [Photobacterium sanctipauli]|uniref:Serine protease n=1 Tax=Photobacterium sanctipauli TaxID=1342794 RepID=A0A2T3NY54_9GAMM|nr:serine protease [Photobacterium sanctipauli]PSW21196.1 serine protease [Photobacterium sanctipauli]